MIRIYLVNIPADAYSWSLYDQLLTYGKTALVGEPIDIDETKLVPWATLQVKDSSGGQVAGHLIEYAWVRGRTYSIDAVTGEVRDYTLTFECGETKTARVRMTNPRAKQFTYTVELYLGADKAATSGQGQVTIPANTYVDVDFTIAMPMTEASYPVFLDVWCAGALLGHFQSIENVIAQISPGIDVGSITWL